MPEESGFTVSLTIHRGRWFKEKPALSPTGVYRVKSEQRTWVMVLRWAGQPWSWSPALKQVDLAGRVEGWSWDGGRRI